MSTLLQICLRNNCVISFNTTKSVFAFFFVNRTDSRILPAATVLLPALELQHADAHVVSQHFRSSVSVVFQVYNKTGGVASVVTVIIPGN